jgi:hypothetical protein
MNLPIVFAILALGLFQQSVFAKEWHGIVPLKSTRTEIERLLGKPNELGRYELNGEAASMIYSSGPCTRLYRPLENANCKCLVAKDTVLSIYVEPLQSLKFSSLGIAKSRFTRTAIVTDPDLFSYSDPTEGIVYTVDESKDAVRDIEFLPSSSDCQLVITTKTPVPRNSWRGLVPLHSDRRKVEEVLGRAKSSSGVDVYDTDNQRVTVRYSSGSCGETNVEWNVPPGTVLEVTVTPFLGFLLHNLDLDLSLYKRQRLGRLPEIPSLPEFVKYVNSRDGLTIRSKLLNGNAEEVVSITYAPSSNDHPLRCRVQ